MYTKIFLNAPQGDLSLSHHTQAAYGAVASYSGYQVPQICHLSLGVRV